MPEYGVCTSWLIRIKRTPTAVSIEVDALRSHDKGYYLPVPAFFFQCRQKGANAFRIYAAINTPDARTGAHVDARPAIRCRNANDDFVLKSVKEAAVDSFNAAIVRFVCDDLPSLLLNESQGDRIGAVGREAQNQGSQVGVGGALQRGGLRTGIFCGIRHVPENGRVFDISAYVIDRRIGPCRVFPLCGARHDGQRCGNAEKTQQKTATLGSWPDRTAPITDTTRPSAAP